LLSEQPVHKGQSVALRQTDDGIVWEILNSNHQNGGPAILRAYDATDVSEELYDSAQAGAGTRPATL
jgi:hypothetical protein